MAMIKRARHKGLIDRVRQRWLPVLRVVGVSLLTTGCAWLEDAIIANKIGERWLPAPLNDVRDILLDEVTKSYEPIGWIFSRARWNDSKVAERLLNDKHINRDPIKFEAFITLAGGKCEKTTPETMTCWRTVVNYFKRLGVHKNIPMYDDIVGFTRYEFDIICRIDQNEIKDITLTIIEIKSPLMLREIKK
ncbi:MAG: hypothetical protein FJX42_08475 [Alphaproteobacteria bacterium]|nr:hypothetical protein [Alphaproteobacteria bacterium]